VKELQEPGTAYTPAPLIQQISNLIRYERGDPADAHELLIALINDISEPISQLFQDQMTSTIKCSSCDSTKIKTDNTQDISLHIEEDASSSLEERLYDFFQPETLEGANAYWCDTCQNLCRATKTMFYTRTPTILIVHLKRLILGKKIQNIPFDSTLNLEPCMTPGYLPIQDMKLIGIISHQGTKDNGHYTAMTKKEDEWTLYNDAITTQISTKHILQAQAYILMYRKTPNLPIKMPPGQNLPRLGRKDGGANPVLGEGPPTANHRGMEIFPNTHDYTPLALETEEGVDVGGMIEGGGESTPPTKMEDVRERPFLQEEKSDQFLGEPINLLQSISVFFHLSQGRIEELTSLLSKLSGTPITMEMTCKWLDLDPT